MSDSTETPVSRWVFPDNPVAHASWHPTIHLHLEGTADGLIKAGIDVAKRLKAIHGLLYLKNPHGAGAAHQVRGIKDPETFCKVLQAIGFSNFHFVPESATATVFEPTGPRPDLIRYFADEISATFRTETISMKWLSELDPKLLEVADVDVVELFPNQQVDPDRDYESGIVITPTVDYKPHRELARKAGSLLQRLRKLVGI